MRYAVTLILLLGVTPGLGAQEYSLERYDLPRSVERRWSDFLSDSSTIRFDGPTRIAPGRTVDGGVAAVGGPFRVAGRILGDLLVVEGDLILEPDADIGGDVMVVGGRARGVDAARIAGSLTAYGEGFRPADRAGRRGARPARDDDEGAWRARGGDARFVVRPGGAYNRVEGLAVRFGPEIRTSGANPMRLRALAVLRSESGDDFDRGDLGYELLAEQFIGGRRALRVGLGAHSVIQPIEPRSVRDLEAALSTFLLHEDPRDHFAREGWRAFLRWTPRTTPVDAAVEYRVDDYATVPAHDPFTLFGDDPWRPQPFVGEGTLRSLGARVALDMRDDAEFPTRGWYAEASVLRGVGGELIVPQLGAIGVPAPDASRPAFAARRFDGGDLAHVSVDVRRYNRVAPDALLGLRLLAGGSPTGDALPPQLQHALGGVGTLPGFDRFAIDCGARDLRVAPAGRAVDEPAGAAFPYYGCDRFALFQVEYIGRFDLDFDFGADDWDDDPNEWDDDPEWWDWHVDFDPAWAVFFDAARGWGAFAADEVDTGAVYDVGAGLLLGDAGVYAALPLNGPDDGLRILIRLGRRF